MAATYRGTKGPVLFAESFDYDPDRGRTIVQSFKGAKAQIMALAWSLEDQGYHIQVRKADGPFYTVDVYSRDLGNAPDSIIHWSVTTAVFQTDLFSFPSIAAEMEASGNPQDYRAGVLKALDEGLAVIATDNSTYTQAAFPWAYIALRELRYGTTHFEEDRVILRRRETISGVFGAAPQMEIGVSQLIYTTAGLGVPVNVPFNLPNIGALDARPASQWGWRFQGRQVDYDGVVTERTHEFALAAWSTNLYTPTTGNFVYTA